MSCKKLVYAFLALLFLAACDETSVLAPQQAADSPREVYLVAIAPDGTRLWKANVAGNMVFFASSGTQWDEMRWCGKTACPDRNQVPSAR